jgi:hypothetical protein
MRRHGAAIGVVQRYLALAARFLKRYGPLGPWLAAVQAATARFPIGH